MAEYLDLKHINQSAAYRFVMESRGYSISHAKVP